MPTRSAMTATVLEILRATLALGLIGAIVASSTAQAQCCGDCDGNGSVEINELVGAVGLAQDGCPIAPKRRIALRGVEVTSVLATLERPALEGRVILTLYGGSDTDTLFRIGPNVDPSIRIVRAEDKLRFSVRYQAAVTMIETIEVDVPDWTQRAHTIVAVWGRGSMSLLVDGVLSGPRPIGEVVLPTGALVRIGNAGETSPVGPYFQEVQFHTD